MAGFFPHQTGTWKLEELQPFRRLSMSVLEMAALTGVLVRVYRAFVLSRGAGEGLMYVAVTFAFGLVLLFGMVTLHLGNYPVRHWLWRAPTFAAAEAFVESLVALGLIALAREPLGTARAAFSDWPWIATKIFIWRVLGIVIFTLVLAGVVQLSRYLLLRHEHREHTFEHIHHTAERKVP